MAGASLAIALQHSKLKVALIESYPLQTDSQPNYDDRGIALSYSSQKIFDSMGIWPQLRNVATPITHIHVSDHGHFGVTRLSAKQEAVPALGQVLTARNLGQQLNQRLQQLKNLSLYCPQQVKNIQQSADEVNVTLDNGHTFTTALLVAADGKDSSIRQLLGLDAWQRTYQQTAVTANVSLDRPHQGIAYERFTDSGPLALLPMPDNRCSLVWTVKAGEEKALLEMTDADFLATLQHRFGYRAGRFTRVGQRHSHPLTLMQADMPVQPRVVLIGNAAHSLHPIAGQGFNLGLRDVAVLAELLVAADDIGDMRLLKNYQDWRQQDQDDTVKATDTLVTLFSNDISLLGHLRGAGLTALDILPFAKHYLAQKSMGFKSRQSKLSRGLPI